MQFLGGLGAVRLPGYPTQCVSTEWGKPTQGKTHAKDPWDLRP